MEKMLDDPVFNGVLSKMSSSALSSLASASARDYCIKGPTIRRTTDMQPDENMDICTLAVLQIHRNSGKSLDREDHTPVFIVAEYETLNRERKLIFSMVWRRCMT
jgi:hypothetical protein